MSHAASSQPATNELGWDPTDPHGSNTHAGHGHVVVGWKLQLSVLAALLFFTVLTVAFYNLEQWVETAFNIHLPNWINVIGAMSIATIKATLVCMFFMQLRYEKALNTFILLFCLFAVGLFLSLSIIDLSTRGWVNNFKYGELQSGGTGVSLGDPPRSKTFEARIAPHVQTSGASLPTYRREAFKAEWLATNSGKTERDFWAYYYGHAAHPLRQPDDTENYFSQLGFDHSQDEWSNANRSVPRYGRTDALELNAGTGDTHAPSAGH